MLLSFDAPTLLIALLLLVFGLVLVWLKSGNIYHVFFCAIFGVYLIAVVGVVVFPFPIVYDLPNFEPSINLIPFDFGFCDPRGQELCLRQIYQNILLTIPFGFGVSFVTRVRAINILWLALTVGFTFECMQLFISLVFRSPFRVVDVNDLLLNAAGVLLGYGGFRVFQVMYISAAQRLQLRGIFVYIHDIVRR